MSTVYWNQACGNLSAFWDTQLSWNTSTPDFPECFQKTVLVWVPCCLLWLLLPAEIHFMKTSRARQIPCSLLNFMKSVLCIILIILHIMKVMGMYMVKPYEEESSYLLIEWIAPISMGITILLSLILIYVGRSKGIQSSGIMFCFWLTLSISGSFIVRSIVLRGVLTMKHTGAKIECIYQIGMLTLAVIQLVLSIFNDKEPLYRDVEDSSDNACPMDRASFLSRVFFGWFQGLLWRCSRETIQSKDVWDSPPSITTRYALPEFMANWKRSKTTNKMPSIQTMIWKIHWPVFAFCFTIRFFGELLNYANPYILEKLFAFLPNDRYTWHGFTFVAAMMFFSLFETLATWHTEYFTSNIVISVKSAMSSIIYRKVLKLSPSTKTSQGKILNHLSVDLNHVTGFFVDGVFAFLLPVNVAIGIAMLYGVLGAAAFAGFGTMVVLTIISAGMVHTMENLQNAQLILKDQRVKQVTEAISGIKVLKMFAWEKPFMERISRIRLKETDKNRKNLILDGVSTMTWCIAPQVVALVSYGTYLAMDSDNVLDVSKAFVTISIVNILGWPMVHIPIAIAGFVQAMVSVRRLNAFLDSKELDPANTKQLESNEFAVVIDRATFSWDENGMLPVLSDVNFEVPRKSLVAIVGQVGTGKSTLLSAILGEVEHQMGGTVATRGKIAYVAQQAWIQNASLKNNVLFGKSFDKELYDKVLEACALLPDLEILPAGDETEIGEKGINLSGGQRQRVSLARAAYQDADLYLLDDPLSAVDAHVGTHIFQKLIGPKGMLRHKSRVLVTHGLTHLQLMDKIVVLDQGVISETGSYTELVENSGAFAKFLAEKSNPNASAASSKLARLKSVISEVSQGDENEEEDEEEDSGLGQLITDEHYESGTVKASVYLQYLRCIGPWNIVGTLLLMLVSYGMYVGSQLWLSSWSGDSPDEWKDISQRTRKMLIFASLVLGYGVMLLGAIVTLIHGTVRASVSFHSHLLLGVLRAPPAFFDTTPSGRVANRFSKDVSSVDELLPPSLQDLLIAMMEIFTAMITICVHLPVMLAFVVPLIALFYFLKMFMVKTGDQLRRLESVTQSPIFSRLSETIGGASTVRAFRKQEAFIDVFENLLDENLKHAFSTSMMYRWLNIRLDILGNFLIFFTGVFSVLERDSLEPGSIAMIITFAASVSYTFAWSIERATQFEGNIVAVERLEEYSNLESEAPWDLSADQPSLNSTWPLKGEISFENFTCKYRENLEPVLHGLSVNIKAGEKVGIVGRTGAGKSSITLALFRLIEAADGRIRIDDIDIASLGLHDVRSRITIIPQDPVLFAGSVRFNLDPFEQHSDEDLWTALDLAHLQTHIRTLEQGLDHEITEGGQNLSVGQRQMMCLARALLRKSRILILDEATAAVDMETDSLIQATVRRQFIDCTVLTIAHRINTVLDSDRILVLENGVVQEFDTPANLLANSQGLFYKMAQDAGIESPS